MQTIQDLRSTFSRAGRVEWIGIRSLKRGPMLSLPEVEFHLLVGLIGDHGKTAAPRLTALSGRRSDELTPAQVTSQAAQATQATQATQASQASQASQAVPLDQRGKRQVTLLQAEHLPVIAALTGLQEVPPELLRRNILISGIPLLALKDRRFQLGDVILEGTGECHPCSRMEENLGPGGYNAVRGHGGITARIIQGGIVRIGAEVKPC